MSLFAMSPAASLTTASLLASSSNLLIGGMDDPAMGTAVSDSDYSLRVGPSLMSITGGGSIGGGGSVNPRAAMQHLFGGEVPTSGSQIQSIVQTHGLLPSLERGTLYVTRDQIAGSPLPRMNTLSMLPVSPEQLFQRMGQVNDWDQTIPNFISSRGTATQDPEVILQEAVMDAESAGNFHYRLAVRSSTIDDGFMIVWSLSTGRDALDPKSVQRRAKPVDKNDGLQIFTEVPGQPDKTLMLYQVHLVPKAGRLQRAFMRMAAPIIEALTMRNFPKAKQAMANRAVDPTWTLSRGDNPSGMNYTLKRV